MLSSSVSSSQSIIFSSFTSSKLLSLSIFASELVRERSESVSSFSSIATSRKSISWAKIVSRSVVASKFFRLSIATLKSMCKSLKNARIACSSISSRTSTSSRSYLTVNDLFRMFAEKSKSLDLQSRQNKSLSSRSFDKCNFKSRFELIQIRITSYFNATISSVFISIKFEAFASTHAREILSRQFAISFSISSTSTSLFRFSKISRSTFVCRNCQERSVTHWSNKWIKSSASRVENNEISMRIHSLTIRRFARFRSTLEEYWSLLERVITLRELACCLFCFTRLFLSVNRLFRLTLRKHWSEEAKSCCLSSLSLCDLKKL